MKKKGKIVKTVLIVLAAAGLAAAIIVYFASGSAKAARAMRKEPLVKFRSSFGGDMRGSHHMTVIRRLDDGRAVLSELSADWYADDGTVTESVIDAKALDELAAIARKYRMDRWEHRKIAKMFVADGGSTGYDFYFGDVSFGFSSQYYPLAYGKKVEKLRDVVEKYGGTGERLPGLVKEATSEDVRPDDPAEGELSFEVYRYFEKELRCRVKNGTDKNVTFPVSFRLFDADSGREIALDRSGYVWESTAYAGRSEDCSVKTAEQLEAGRYRLELGEFKTEFEIR